MAKETKTATETAATPADAATGTGATASPFKCQKCSDTGLIPTPGASGKVCDCSSGKIEADNIERANYNAKVVGELKELFPDITHIEQLPALMKERLEQPQAQQQQQQHQHYSNTAQLGRRGMEAGEGILLEGGIRIVVSNIGHYEELGERGIRIVMAAGAKYDWQAPEGPDGAKIRARALRALDRAFGITKDR
ncbi:MAG TPA: hypothetical protein VH413_16420 [Verrucomicrobiae bacterium]|nr:hypothetical protein [Verrucomicrobiae bacterium]